MGKLNLILEDLIATQTKQPNGEFPEPEARITRGYFWTPDKGVQRKKPLPVPPDGEQIELKSCPFCGKSGYAVPLGSPDDKHTRWQVECAASLCPANPCVEADTKEQAIAAWNHRADPH